jgi:hypothetical protein
VVHCCGIQEDRWELEDVGQMDVGQGQREILGCQEGRSSPVAEDRKAGNLGQGRSLLEAEAVHILDQIAQVGSILQREGDEDSLEVKRDRREVDLAVVGLVAKRSECSQSQ